MSCAQRGQALHTRNAITATVPETTMGLLLLHGSFLALGRFLPALHAFPIPLNPRIRWHLL